MAEEFPNVLRPRPLRPGDNDLKLTPRSSSSDLANPLRELRDSIRLGSEKDEKGQSLTGTRSALNLTSSTLFGIFSPSTPDDSLTPGIQTPAPRRSIDDQQPPVIGAFERADQPPKEAAHRRTPAFSIVLRTSLLFLTGVVYGIFISQLHDSQQIAPVQLETVDRWSWWYLLGWGLVGVFLGALLPWMDIMWEEVLGDSKDVFLPNQEKARRKSLAQEESRPTSRSGKGGIEARWNPIVRSITVFIGIAFAIRRLPWQSTLQVSVTLALVNPVLWYLLDRSKPGFLLSAIVGVAGTIIALNVNPDIVPSPPTASPLAGGTIASTEANLLFDGKLSVERIGVGTWIASVLFCSSLCFGNIGRRLVLGPSFGNFGFT